ncbi:MAG: hypothetical protein ABIR71_06325 [Chthoniobacterales bacterium]
MTTAGAPSTEYAPLFDWGPPRRRRISFFTFLAGSIVLHALCFYLFQIVYPLTVALLPPPARINLITGDSEQGRLLLRWVEAEDPALSSTTQRPPAAESTLLPSPSHVPSYLHRQSALKQLPRYKPDLSIPSAHPPGPVALPRAAPPSPAGITASKVQFARQAEMLGAPHLPDFHFTASRQDPPASAQFRVAISARGVVLHCFLETSSGDPALDEQARRVLLLCRFPGMEKRESKIENNLLWTTAAWEWGNDLAPPAATSAESPAP